MTEYNINVHGRRLDEVGLQECALIITLEKSCGYHTRNFISEPGVWSRVRIVTSMSCLIDILLHSWMLVRNKDARDERETLITNVKR